MQGIKLIVFSFGIIAYFILGVNGFEEAFADFKEEQKFEKLLEANSNKGPFENDNIQRIIILNSPVTQKDTDHFAKNNIKVLRTFHIIPAILVEIPSAAEGGIQKLNQVSNGNNKFVKSFPNSYGRVSLDDSVPQINGGIPYNIGLKGDGIKVCLADSGVNPHNNLPTPVAQHDFVNNDSFANDDNSHGTHVAGVISSNHATYRGVAPNVSLLAVKVCDNTGFCSVANILSGIQWCVDNNADVINMSFGVSFSSSTCDNLPESMAANAANTAGIVAVASTGNQGMQNAITSPACASGVIAVAAVNESDAIWPSSNRGNELDIVAPGVNVVSTHFNGGSQFGITSGTSHAVPHVTGAAALILQKFPSYTPQQVKNDFYNNTVDLGTAGFDTTFGNGRLDVAFLDDSCSPPADGDWTITSSCTLITSKTISSGDTWTINPGVTLTINSEGYLSSGDGTINNSGTIVVNSGGQLRADNGEITNNSGGTISNSGGITNNSGGFQGFDNFGTINNNPGGTITTNSFSHLANNGIISNSGTFTLFGGILHNISGGTFTNNPGGTIANTNNPNVANALIRNLSGATLNNLGTINNSGNTISCGTYTGALPSSGNQIIFCTTTVDTTINLSATLPLLESLIINPGAVMTINSGVSLSITCSDVIVKSGGGILVKSGGILSRSCVP